METRGDGRPGPSPDGPTVAVYRDLLLASSETFIRSQGEAMRRYRAHYVGMHRVRDLDLPSERVLVLNKGGAMGRASEWAFKLLGVSPPVVRAVRAIRPVLLHAHFGPDGAVALPLARRLGVPLVVTFHGYDATTSVEELRRSPFNSLRRVYVRRRAELARDVRLVVAVSRFIRDRLLAQGWPAEKIVVHYIGVDTDLFRPDPATRREPIVLFVGRLVEKKGVAYLIAAMREVQARLPDAEVVVVGKGRLRKSLEERAREAGVRARFLGGVPPEEVRGWMRRAAVLCAPSVTAANGDAEGLPIVVLEAMAMGLPVVGSLSAGIPEAVAHGVTGLLAPEGHVAALAAHLTAVLSDASLRERLGSSGRGRVVDEFDLLHQTARLEDIYDDARRAGGPRARERSAREHADKRNDA
jgi:colanic acid/amylovoran biosynthesis glycosyltransferase